jgi:ubiquinone/menaquinone biosynthesis C-methylase UbiE
VADVPFDFQSAYDALNADDHDYRFYAALAHELRAHHVLDLGCGTGVLARLLASNGHIVVAIDPDPDMVRVARDKPGAERVDWRESCDRNVLAFRDHEAVGGSLLRAGYEVTRGLGDLSGASLTDESPEIIAIARRT